MKEILLLKEIDLNLNAGLFESQQTIQTRTRYSKYPQFHNHQLMQCPNAIAAPTQYTATSAMQDYANTIHKGILETLLLLKWEEK